MRTWPVPFVWLICAAAAAVVAFWGGQDKQGQFSLELLGTSLPALLFFVGPYFVLAVAALVGKSHEQLSFSVLVATAVLAAIGVWAQWIDHDTYLRTPPGREVTPMLGFLATLLLWLGSAALLLTVGATVARRKAAVGRAARD